MHVCLHVCGKFVGGCLKGDYAHLFVTVYIYLSGITDSQKYASQKLHLAGKIIRMSAVTRQSNYKKVVTVVDSKSLKDIAVNEVT